MTSVTVPREILLTRRTLCVGTAVTLLLLAVALRLMLAGFVSDDIRYFFGPWRATFQEVGVRDGIASTFTDYTPPYLYLLAASTWLPVGSVTAVKLIALLAELALLAAAALFLHRIVRARPSSKAIGLIALVFGPTVLFNSALWGQVDAAWTAPLIAALALGLTGRPRAAMALVGFALSIKLQAVFVSPVFAYLILVRAIPLRDVVGLPVGYLAGFLPAIAMGLPVSSLWSVYLGQTGTYPALTLNAPNVHQLFPDRADVLAAPATCVTAALVVVLIAWLGTHQTTPSGSDVLAIALLFALLVPYLLPHMHERYFYAADVLAVLYAVARPERWWLPVVVVGTSFLSYLPYLFATDSVVPFPVLAVAMGTALLAVLRDVVQDASGGARAPRPPSPTGPSPHALP